MATSKVKVHIPAGFKASAVSAGLKASGKLDVGIIIADGPAACGAVFTTNRFQAAPIRVTRDRIMGTGRILRGVVVNAGNANAMTGEPGVKDAIAMAAAAERATGAPQSSFLVASTGVIGNRMPMDKVLPGVAKAAEQLSADGWDKFAQAIVTTDLVTKVSSRKVPLPDGTEFSILGMAKGSGMIMPNMATMLAFIVTDFPMLQSMARPFIKAASDETFNCITVDGQTSTNDMALLISSRLLPRKHSVPRDHQQIFADALREVCADLAKMIARDGEGATRLVAVSVRGANRPEQARRIACTVANSMLVKTALYGADPNWGRIVQALGQASVSFRPEDVGIKIMGVPVLRAGAPVTFDRPKLAKAMSAKEVEIEITIGNGPGLATVWTCDLTEGYIAINAHYN